MRETGSGRHRIFGYESELKKIVFELCIAMPLLYTATYMLNDGNANRVVICHLIVSFALLIKQLAAKGKRTTFLVITFGTIFYVMYTSCIIYPQYIMHTYFYSYLFAIILFVLFSDEYIREDFYQYFLRARKRVKVYFLLFVVLIGYSIVFMNGLQHSISMPVLYGPFTLPHYLSYILLVIYCGIYLQYKDTDKKNFISSIKKYCRNLHNLDSGTFFCISTCRFSCL